ncbi:MAG TPA: hypothetical protein VE575_03625 [Acidimicrobiales bacterium]|nr:hypothetical protein [Acidimicrobiales bacterium]
MAGVRPRFEMEKILPGVPPDDWDDNPIVDAVELHEAGDDRAATRLLRDLVASDVRCVDAWAHLGFIAFDTRGPGPAGELYEQGVAVAELSLPEQFRGVLPRGLIDNRPFLRCLHGLALCRWRQRRWDDAEALLTARVWLDPTGSLDALACSTRSERGTAGRRHDDHVASPARVRPRAVAEGRRKPVVPLRPVVRARGRHRLRRRRRCPRRRAGQPAAVLGARPPRSGFRTYLAIDWAAAGMAPEHYWQDLCELLASEVYGLTYQHDTLAFQRVPAGQADLVESILLELADEWRAANSDYQADEAVGLVAWLHVAGRRYSRYVDAARRLGSDQWQPVVALAESAHRSGRQELAVEVFRAADRPGRQRDHLRHRCAELTGFHLDDRAPRLRVVR